ncbi:hypothetical protein M378DRAFT_1059564, partial [Amanita muscaria Koide BX008]
LVAHGHFALKICRTFSSINPRNRTPILSILSRRASPTFSSCALLRNCMALIISLLVNPRFENIGVKNEYNMEIMAELMVCFSLYLVVGTLRLSRPPDIPILKEVVSLKAMSDSSSKDPTRVRVHKFSNAYRIGLPIIVRRNPFSGCTVPLLSGSRR